MNLVFVDLIPWDYDVATPFERPLGGSQSALCYLAVELARMGHRVTLISKTSRPGTVRGVECLNAESIDPRWLAQPFDAVVALNCPAEIGLDLRSRLAAATPLVLWTQHAHDQPAMKTLARPEARSAWDVIACVSEWHRARMIESFGLEPSRVAVLRNAIGPTFEGLFHTGEELAQAKAGPLVLAYTSTPFRGLNVLLPIFAGLREAFPDVALNVFSSLKVYQQDEADDPCKSLYDQCRSAPGVRFIGSLPQPELAVALKSASILAYPNTFPETSCIAVMEALAAGLYVVTSRLGALPETTLGFGPLVEAARSQEDIHGFAHRFLAVLAEVVKERIRDPAGFASARLAQVQATNAHFTWRVRAKEWEAAIPGWKTIRENRNAGWGFSISSDTPGPR